MKKALLLSFSLLFTLTLSADIIYVDYGDDWRIGLNADENVDINGDGVIDFSINGYADELGFIPLFAIGCFSSTHELAYTPFNARELQIHAKDELIKLDSYNLYDYIDDDRASIYSTTGGFADGWADLEEQYIGFVLITPAGYMDGWMTVAVDVVKQELIIRETAYEDAGGANTPGILAGDKGITNVQNLDKQLSDLNISPNPVNESMQLSFDYQSSTDLSIVIFNNVGQAVYQNNTAILANRNIVNITTSDWAVGNYFIRFKSEEGVHTERVVVMR